MFEKEAEERTKQYMDKHTEKYNCENTKLETDNYNIGREYGYEEGFKDGAEFGYNKANEWHYLKDRDFPNDRTEKKYLVALKSEYGSYFFETDIWCESLHCFASNHPTKVYAWKEIVLPELKESE